jgi:hypothetical protein
MKKSELRELVKEAMQGYEKKDGKLVPHSDKFDSTKLSNILMRIAKSKPEGGDPEEGERILTQKSDPQNVARILRGEKPMYKESALSPGYLTNIYSDSPIKEFMEATVYDDGRVAITLRNSEGRAAKRTAAIPLKELTEDYLRGLIIDTGFKYNDTFQQGVADFIAKVFSNPKVKSVQSV